MSNYQIIITRSAKKQLDNPPSEIRHRIQSKIDALASEPRLSGCLKLKGEENKWRIRVGDYRIIYEIDDQSQIIDIQKVRHRREIYDK